MRNSSEFTLPTWNHMSTRMPYNNLFLFIPNLLTTVHQPHRRTLIHNGIHTPQKMHHRRPNDRIIESTIIQMRSNIPRNTNHEPERRVFKIRKASGIRNPTLRFQSSKCIFSISF